MTCNYAGDDMQNSFTNMAVKHIDEQLASWRKLADSVPPKGGWIRTIRESLGMTQSQLAARLKITQQALNDLEKSEAEGKITLDSLRRLANALGCRFVYAAVPEQPLGEIRRQRAHDVAKKQLGRVSRSMKLEAQGTSERETKRQIEELTEELLRGSPRKLWQ
jgi:predicted DNA-binding mobile mystery protein A